jgi:hypothetical protein
MINPWVPKSSIISLAGLSIEIGIIILVGFGYLCVKNTYYVPFGVFVKINNAAEFDNMTWSILCSS